MFLPPKKSCHTTRSKRWRKGKKGREQEEKGKRGGEGAEEKRRLGEEGGEWKEGGGEGREKVHMIKAWSSAVVC